MNTQEALRWVMEEFLDRERPHTDWNVPAHLCEFHTNPEAGHCEFHSKWVDAAREAGLIELWAADGVSDSGD